MAAAQDISTLIASFNQLAASWYNGVKYGTPVTAPSPAELALAQSAGSTQAAFQQANPVLAGLLINPGFLLIVIASIVLLVILFRRR